MFVILVALLLTGPQKAEQPKELSAQELTVQPERLPRGCSLAPAPFVSDEPNRVRGNLWGNLPLPHNPYAGKDPLITLLVRERFEPRPKAIDGSPKTKEAIMAGATEGIEEVYVAFYMAGRDTLVEVFAMKRAALKDHPIERRGPILAGPYDVLTMGEGECHRAVWSICAVSGVN